MKKTGKFITFEGGEGAGKSTVIQAVKTYLIEKGYDVIVTREPGGTPIAEQIREVILSVDNIAMAAKTEVLLYAAARAQHLAEFVEPQLAQGKIVLCDRFVDSSLVYQAYARDLGFDVVYELNSYAIGTCWPQATILLDVEPKIGLARVFNSEGREVNRLDQESYEFHMRVYEGYHDLAKRFSDRFVIVDANQHLDAVIEQTQQVITKVIEHVE